MINVSFNPNMFNYNRFNTKYNKHISFKGTIQDTFQRCSGDIINETKLTELLNNPSFRVSKEFLDSLTPKAYEFCLNFAKSIEKTFKRPYLQSQASVLPDDVQDIAKYSIGFLKGLEKIAKQNGTDLKDVLIVAIGQSPDSIVKAMEFKGLKTGYCPISYLRNFRIPDPYINEETIKNGFSHWRDFGFDLDSLFKEKLIIFIDHRETGATLDCFQGIIRKIINIMGNDKFKDKKPSNMLFLAIKDIHKGVKHDVSDVIKAREIEEDLFHKSYFKTLYSPLFKLPLDKISSIDELSKLNSEANTRFNKFSILLYDEMKKPEIIQEFKSRSSLQYQREYRLSAVMGNLFS